MKTVAEMNVVVGKAIVAALKDCVDDACAKGVDPGFKGIPKIKIPLPEGLAPVEKALRTIQMGSQVDSFVELLNEAASNAVPGCQPILHASVDSMEILNAKELFESKDPTACSKYLKEDSFKRGLREQCRAPVKEVLKTSTVVTVYETLMSAFNAMPEMVRGPPVEFHLEDYVVDSCIAGLFVLIEEREAAIRADPNITKVKAVIDVFGNTTIYQGCVVDSVPN